MSSIYSASISVGRKNFARKRRGYLYALLSLIFISIVVCVFLLETSTCSFLRGTCQYDPRTQSPSSLFISEAPELPIVQYIQDQIRIDGTFPMSATSKVSSIIPVAVSAEGFNTDLHIYAHVDIQIEYGDAPSQLNRFDVMAQEAGGLFGVESSTMFARFKPVDGCGEAIDPATNTSSGETYYCR